VQHKRASQRSVWCNKRASQRSVSGIGGYRNMESGSEKFINSQNNIYAEKLISCYAREKSVLMNINTNERGKIYIGQRI
jgi:hypothetical protein